MEEKAVMRDKLGPPTSMLKKHYWPTLAISSSQMLVNSRFS